MPNPLITVKQNQPWQNKHQTVSVTPSLFYDVFNLWADAPPPAENQWVAGLQGLRAVVAEAERTNRRVRALGGAWSLSDAAATQDIMVNTRPLNYIELGLRQDHVDPGFTGDRASLCFSQCGASVLELYQYLEPRGFTLPTGGASNGQTFAGAVSTGTHGSANAVGAMQDYILGLHLVVNGGKTVWLERASRPAVSSSFCQALGAELRRDDELFNAAVVGFGSFGIVHALLFQPEPCYLLEKSTKRVDYAAVKKALSTLDVSGLGLSGGNVLPFHLEFIVNPYATGTGDQSAYVRYMYKRSFAEVPPGGPGSGIVQGDDAMGFLGTVTDIVPDVAPALIGHLLSLFVPIVNGVRGTPGQQFGPTDVRGNVNSTEIGVALADAESAIDAIVTVAKQFPWGGFPAVRYVKGSDATLAFTHFSPITCTIEIPSAGSARSRAAFERVWVELHRRNIAFTLHWGQCMHPSLMHFESGYGDRVNRWKNARAALLGDAGRHLFSSDWLVSLGLD